jgi:hypothetical protein
MRNSKSTKKSRCAQLFLKLVGKLRNIFQRKNPQVVGENVCCLVCCTRRKIMNAEGIKGSPDKDFVEDHPDTRDGRKKQCEGAYSRIATGRHKGRMLP